MLADFTHLLLVKRARLVQDRHRDERLADVVQQRGARQAALVVLPHAEILRIRHRKSGDKQAVAIGVGMVAADGRQPFAQRGMLDGLEDLAFGLHDIVECQRLAGGKLLEHLDDHRVRSFDTAIQGLAAIGRIIARGVRKGGAHPLQDGRGIERPRDGVGCAERPSLHRGVVKRVGQDE